MRLSSDASCTKSSCLGKDEAGQSEANVYQPDRPYRPSLDILLDQIHGDHWIIQSRYFKFWLYLSVLFERSPRVCAMLATTDHVRIRSPTRHNLFQKKLGILVIVYMQSGPKSSYIFKAVTKNPRMCLSFPFATKACFSVPQIFNPIQAHHPSYP